MREIKFRAWDIQAKRMIGWRELIDYGSGLAEYLVNPRELIFSQYTGIHDKNGREIYERDITKIYLDPVERKREWLQLEMIEVVKWDEYSDGEYINHIQCWMVEGLPLSEAGSGETYGHLGFEVEVIGNIDENPELLEAL